MPYFLHWYYDNAISKFDNFSITFSILQSICFGFVFRNNLRSIMLAYLDFRRRKFQAKMIECMLDCNDGACYEQVHNIFQPIDFTDLRTIRSWTMLRVMMLNIGASYTERIFRYISSLFLFYGLYSLNFLLIYLRFTSVGFTKSIFTLVLID